MVSVAEAFVTLRPDASKFGNELSGALKPALAIAGGFLTGAAVAKVAGDLSSAVDAASELQDSINAVNVVFGEAAGTVQEFGDTSANAIGLSRDEFNKLAGPLGAMLKNAGFGMDEVGGKTIDLTKRAADMASVFGGSVGDALGAVTAALRGETDPIERYGVAVNAAKTEARALADTGKTVAKDLTDQEKAAARLALIFEQTAAVEGDFANTSGDLANKTRSTNAELADMQAELGTRLLPVALKITEVKLALARALTQHVIPAFERLVPFIIGAWDALKDFIGDVRWVVENGTGFDEKLSTGPLKDWAEVLGGVVTVVLDFIDALKGNEDVAGGFGDKLSSGGWSMAHDLVRDLAGFIRDDLAPAFGTLFGFLNENKDTIASIAAGIAAFLALQGVIALVVGLATAIGGAVAFITGMTAAFTAATSAVGLFGAVVAVAGGPLTLIVVAIAAVVAAIVFAVTHWEEIKAVMQRFVDWLGDRFAAAMDWLREKVSGIGEWMRNAAQGFTDAWQGLRDRVTGIVTGVVTWIGDKLTWLYDHVGKVRKTVDAAVEAWTFLKDTASAIVTALVTWIGDRWTELTTRTSEAFTAVAEVIGAAWEAVKGAFQAAWDAIIAILETAWGLLLDAANQRIDDLKTVFGTLKDRILEPLADAGNWLLDVGRRIMEGLIRGVTSMAGALKEAVINAAKSVGAWFVDFLEISSPSRVFMGYGEQIMRGLALGIEQNAGLAQAALGKVPLSFADVPRLGAGAGGGPGWMAGSSTATSAAPVQQSITVNVEDRSPAAIRNAVVMAGIELARQGDWTGI